jgi:hypothetical protein
MIGEVDLYGVLVPPLLVWLGGGLLVSAVLRFGLNRAGFYRFVWHRPLFDLAILVIATGAVAMLANMFL